MVEVVGLVPRTTGSLVHLGCLCFLTCLLFPPKRQEGADPRTAPKCAPVEKRKSLEGRKFRREPRPCARARHLGSAHGARGTKAAGLPLPLLLRLPIPLPQPLPLHLSTFTPSPLHPFTPLPLYPLLLYPCTPLPLYPFTRLPHFALLPFCPFALAVRYSTLQYSTLHCACSSSSCTVGLLHGGVVSLKDFTMNSSEEQLLGCDTVDSACSGVFVDNGFAFAEKRDLYTEAKYSHTTTKGTCKDSSCTVDIFQRSVTEYKDVSTDIAQALILAAAQQPVSTAIEADQCSF